MLNLKFCFFLFIVPLLGVATQIYLNTILTYKKGPLLSGKGSINVYVMWYGNFPPADQSVISDFISSFSSSSPSPSSSFSLPSVHSWWKTTTEYLDTTNNSTVSASLKLEGEAFAPQVASMLTRSNISDMVESAIATKVFSEDPNAIYLLLTADDVPVEGFCMSSCGFHSHLSGPSTNQSLAFAWVGNARKQCPGMCAWPFHPMPFGPQTPALSPPNGDIGIDGMIINIATVLAGAATNPFNNGYYQGDAEAPLEAVSACPGIFGKGSYPGYPGQLLIEETSGASFNAQGANRKFLLPSMWSPSSKSCVTL